MTNSTDHAPWKIIWKRMSPDHKEGTICETCDYHAQWIFIPLAFTAQGKLYLVPRVPIIDLCEVCSLFYIRVEV